MVESEIRERIAKWHEVVQEVLEQQNKLTALIGDGWHESPVGEAYGELLLSYSDSVVELLGLPTKEPQFKDRDHILNWFVYDNDMGESALSCYISGKEYVIRDINRLADFIVDWLAEPETADQKADQYPR